MDSKFSWVQTHKDLAEYLQDKEDKQKELVDLLRQAGVTAGLVDEEPKGNRFDLEEIDPFSFFCFIYKYGPDKRLQILQNIASELDLHYPEDELGIPSAQAQKVMMFPFKDGRNNNEIENLWQFFYSALDDSITDEQFESILNQYGVGPVKITEALFYIDPENYFPIDGPTKPYLKQVLGVDPNFSTWQEYLDILNKIKKKTDQPFYEISYKAWVWLEEQKRLDKKYQIFQELLDRYKQFLKDEGIEEERYKWEAIQHFLQTFDTEADDFTENFNAATSKAANLVYQNSIGFIRKAVMYFPEEVREMFKALYDESKPLQERYQKFVEVSEELLPKVIETHGKQLNHQQDERTISYYLTMRYPDKYPLYKNETYQYLISLFDDQDAKPAGEKLFHYLELAEDLVPVIESDGDVIDMIEDQLTEECYQGEQQWLVFQDVLWINMRTIGTSNYWVFQGNPKVFDVEQALKDEALTSWRVNAHKAKITPGDKVILWVTGDQSGCYALAEVESDVHEDSVNEAEVPYYGDAADGEPFDQVKLRITHNLAEDPITKEQINSYEKLTGLNVGNQGTNFSATQEEYEALVELAEGAGDAMWNKLVKVVSKIDNEQAVRKFFATVRHVLIEFDLSDDDEITYASSIKKYIQFTIGSRYVTHLERKSGKVIQGFYVDNEHLEELKTNYPSLEISDKAVPPEEGDMTWVYMEADDVQVKDFFEGIVSLAKKGIESQSKSQYRSIYPDKHNPWIAKVALDDDLLEKLLKGEKMPDQKKKQVVNYPLNTIFYGPPGTGKTYTTIKRAAEIVEGDVIEDYNEAKQIFNKQLGETIEFITFHQNYSYEDFIQGLRPDTENDKELTFDRVDGLFKELADKALKNYEASKRPQTKKKSFEDVFNTFIDPLVQGEVQEIEVEMKRVSYYITAVTNRSIEFRKASGVSSHTLSISTLRRMYEAEDVLEIQGLSSYYSPLLDKLLDMGKSPGETETVERKNYVLIIDEINRANISRVFGELITLIEPDKRYGREMHIPARLPSGESFSVPENLYIIGTMNTADKSIALLDIALRRRFEFEAMYPKYVIDGEQIHDSDVLQKINDRIKKLKGHDFQIGHSYFMKNHVTLKQRMNRRVIPLLLEYFMNDEKEVRDILTHAGLSIKEDSWPLEITGRA
ncbi:EVE domain-containing protein [Rhodohalobacter sp. 8-1]|uniref:EVE domain-containing protein n=1 Tax=Rhodohalobacter sp. 8-1 TaxID=3131972 RepID=UPI0030EDF335